MPSNTKTRLLIQDNILMKTEFQNIQDILLTQISPERINAVYLPDNLLDTRIDEENNDRFAFIYNDLYGPLCVTITETLK